MFGVLEGIVYLKDTRQEHRCKVVALDTVDASVIHDLIVFFCFCFSLLVSFFLLSRCFLSRSKRKEKNGLSEGGKEVVRGPFCWELAGKATHPAPLQVK